MQIVKASPVELVTRMWLTETKCGPERWREIEVKGKGNGSEWYRE